MNNVVLSGRLTADPDVRQTGNTTMATYTLAVDRRFKREGEPDADFIRCVVFGRGAEFAQNYLGKGIKIMITGRINTGNYEKDGIRHYTTDIIVDQQEFAESKKASENAQERPEAPDDFMVVPESIQEELPFT